jgi:hypothetical protein
VTAGRCGPLTRRPASEHRAPPLTTGPFAPANVADLFDMLIVHEYPTTGQAPTAISLIRSFAAYGKPVLLGKTFVLSDDAQTQSEFLTHARTRRHAQAGPS